MNARAAFGLSILMSLVSSTVVAVVFAWPWLRAGDGRHALIWLVIRTCFCALLE
jgi:hypothetical protein